ncbi:MULTISPECIES: hypothetical protein [unclassified Ruegeria]|uniref:hypothetical protein n=2 Tax=Ruegeria TaxID=97050 RepID=UPI0014916CBA|nr:MULTISPECIES: hypothetical protein [unclassified Ruegeria]NOC45426.1 hypothetical protein [Ruegeria sp. HKCCD7559]NOD85045.1 hypothetical protein [Ruegeria sp. HKCCD6119]
MSIQTALNSAMETIPDCIAAGYIDMETGMLLGSSVSDSDCADSLDVLAVAVANLFQGRGVAAFEALLRQAGSADEENAGFGEVAVFSKDRLNIFLRTKEYPDHVVCYICRNSANVGLALTKSHLSLGPVAAAV